MVRGINKAAIFSDDQDRQRYPERLGKQVGDAISRVALRIEDVLLSRTKPPVPAGGCSGSPKGTSRLIA